MRQHLIASFLMTAALSWGGPSLAQQSDVVRDLLATGLEKSETLKAAEQSYISATQGLVIANSGNDMTGSLSLSGTKAYTDKPTVSGGFKGSESTSSKITLSKRLYDFGEGDAKYKQAQLQLEQSATRYESRLQSVLFSLYQSYLTLNTTREAVKLQQGNVTRLEEQTRAAEIRLASGTATPTTVAQAKSRLARAQSNLISAEADAIAAEESFESLFGSVPTQMPAIELPQNLPVDILSAETIALSEHPDMRAALLAEQLADIQFDVLIGSVGPRVNFSLSAAINDNEGKAQDKEELSASLTFSAPILTTPSTRAKSIQTSASLNQAKHELRETRRSLRLGARAAFRDFAAALAQLEAVEAEIEAAQLVAEGTRSEVEYGLKTFLDELNSDQSLDDARLRKVQTSQNLLISAFRLLQSTGQLNVASAGLSDEYGMGRLDNLPELQPIFTGILPIASERR